MRGRFGQGGVYTDFRILVPLVLMAMVLILGWHKRDPAHDLAHRVMLEEVEQAMAEVDARSVSRAPDLRPLLAEKVPVIHMDGTPAEPSVTADPALLYAAGLGFVIAGMGVVGSLILLRGVRSEPGEPQVE